MLGEVPDATHERLDEHVTWLALSWEAGAGTLSAEGWHGALAALGLRVPFPDGGATRAPRRSPAPARQRRWPPCPTTPAVESFRRTLEQAVRPTTGEAHLARAISTWTPMPTPALQAEPRRSSAGPRASAAIDRLRARWAEAIELKLAELTASRSEVLERATAYLREQGGKRIRPLLTLAAAEASGGDPRRALPLAAAVEWMHQGTLVLDDIIDAAAVRRGHTALHSATTDVFATGVAAFVLGRVLQACHGMHPDIRDYVVSAALALADGERLELLHTGDAELSMTRYYAIIEAKTARLFSCATGVGALCAEGDRKVVRALTRYGRELGLAFQIIDDLLDYTAEAATFGKRPGTDLRAAKMTLPLLLLREHYDRLVARGRARPARGLARRRGGPRLDPVRARGPRHRRAVPRSSGRARTAGRRGPRPPRRSSGLRDPRPARPRARRTAVLSDSTPLRASLREVSVASVAKRVGMWFLSLVVVIVLYGLGKLGATWFEPTTLPLTALDEALPFMPWTVWIYGTVTWVSLLAWLTIPDRSAGARLFTTMALASVTCCAVFLLFPTTFPRELFPVPAGDSATFEELRRLRLADSPTNCLPSLHVALAWGIVLTWVASSRAADRDSAPWRLARLVMILWAIGISLTTVTTKQHFVLDVPTGAAVGVVCWWAAGRIFSTETTTPAWARFDGLALTWPKHLDALAKLRRNVEGYQWELDEIDWPEGPLPPLDPTLIRLINELIYIEEIAGFNFGVLARAAKHDDLRALYQAFADEERRHADGLRHVLELHGAPLRPPGMGNSLVLHEFDALDPKSDADVFLVATANPVFETMLDAGTVPFLRRHPALRSEWFEDFVKKITRDESAHMAVNWMVIREAGERYRGLSGLRLLLNPSIPRGMVAVPFMSLDVYSLAHRLGYEFHTLLPAFGKLWRLHRRYRELRWFPLWWVFRMFTAAGAIATFACVALSKLNLMFIRFWCLFTKITDGVARVLFGRKLLSKRGLSLSFPGNG